MNGIKWRFKALSIGDPERDPHEAEFFNLAGISEVIVREFIQNTLDAKTRPMLNHKNYI